MQVFFQKRLDETAKKNYNKEGVGHVRNVFQRIGKKMKKRVYLIGNAHLDPVWLRQWQEGFAEVKATFRSAVSGKSSAERP